VVVPGGRVQAARENVPAGTFSRRAQQLEAPFADTPRACSTPGVVGRRGGSGTRLKVSQMIATSHHCFGLKYLVIGCPLWEREHATETRFRCYEVLDLWEAVRALEEMARDDMGFVRRVADDVLGFRGDLYAGGYEHAGADARLLDELTGRLGVFSAHNQPPDFAWFYVCRRKPFVPVPEDAPRPERRTLEEIDAARRAPRGYVVVETVDDAGAPVPHVPLEVLLADGELLARATDTSGRLHLAPIPQGRCHIRVVDRDGHAWRPEQGEASSCVDRTHKRAHTVKRGENLTRIAKQYGHGGWSTLWKASDNEALRKRRKNPNLLYPGDEVVVPAIELHAIRRPTDQTHRIVIGRARAVVALLNAHLLAAAADVAVHWHGGSSTLAATSALFRDETSMSLRLSDVAEHARLALVAPLAKASEQPGAASASPSGPGAA
jgi:LysM domain